MKNNTFQLLLIVILAILSLALTARLVTHDCATPEFVSGDRVYIFGNGPPQCYTLPDTDLVLIPKIAGVRLSDVECQMMRVDDEVVP